MRHALAFATNYPGWHSFDRQRSTVDAIARLAAHGLVETNEFRQFRVVLS